MKKFWKPIVAVLIFCIIQLLGSVVMSAYEGATNPAYREAAASGDQSALMNAISPITLAVVVALSGIITVLICWLGLRMFRMSEAFRTSSLRWGLGIVAFIAAICGITSFNLISEQLDLPNIIEAQMLGMAASVWGMLTIGVIGPICEELVFREAVCGGMLRQGVKPWTAILVSALLFGLIHFNPAQIPFAFLTGVILAVVYYRTHSVVLPCLIHIFNNSQAVVQMNVMGEKAEEFTLTEWLGQPTAYILMAVGLLLCIALLRWFWQKTE